MLVLCEAEAIEAVDDFIVDTNALAKLPHVLQESSDNHKEFSHEPH